MTDSTNTEATQEVTEEAEPSFEDKAASAETRVVDNTRKDDAEDTEEEETPSVEFLQKELTKTREEAAARRVENRELREKLASAKTPEEFEAALKESEEKAAEYEHKLLQIQVAETAGLSSKVATRLQGKTIEELEADALVLKEAFGSSGKPAPRDDGRLKGGLSPQGSSGASLPTDPAEIAKLIGRGKK